MESRDTPLISWLSVAFRTVLHMGYRVLHECPWIRYGARYRTKPITGRIRTTFEALTWAYTTETGSTEMLHVKPRWLCL
jgi:hypothetical protein